MLLLALSLAHAIDVTVTEDPRRDRWTAAWMHDQPVRGFAFTRHRNPVQADWKAKKGRIREVDGYQIWTAPPGELVQGFEATFRTETGWLEKDYELNVAFSDGARLLYTDHLFVVPLTCPGGAAECDDSALEGGAATVHHFDFRTAEGRSVVTPDGRGDGTARWSQRGRGVYVYFGEGEALGGSRATFLLDPGLPGWVRTETEAWIGPLFDHYTAQTGRPLGFAPVVFVSYTSGREGDLSLGGGGMPGQMQLQIRGGGWADQNKANRLRYARFLAHETFHMWNGEEVRTHLGPSEEWLSEGSAELFSWWAVEALGLAEPSYAEEQVVAAAARCVSDLGGEPLLTAPENGNYGAFYPCGAAALYQLHHRADLPEAFAAMFADGTTSYSTYDLLEEVHARSEDPLATGFVERLLRRGLGERPAAAWAGAFGDALALEEADAWTVDDLPRSAYHSALVATVARCDCGGAMSVWDEGDTLRFEALAACDALSTEMRVDAMAGAALSDRQQALAAAWEAIEAQGSFELSGPEGVRTVTCPEDVTPPQALRRTP